MLLYLGCNGNCNLECLEEVGVSNILVSYISLQKSPAYLSQLRGFKSRNPHSKIFLDSGAFTIQRDTSFSNWDMFFLDYADFLDKNIDLFECYVELDIENIIGLERVQKFTNYLKQKLSKPPIEVWHIWRGGVEYWEKMCEENDYIGFSGVFSVGGGYELAESDYPEFFRIAQKNNCKIHGFGITSWSKVVKYPFYSVDSTSWLAGSMYGKIPLYEDNKIRIISSTHPYHSYLVQGDCYAKMKWGALQWKRFADSLDPK
jgi:hypothetical protein